MSCGVFIYIPTSQNPRFHPPPPYPQSAAHRRATLRQPHPNASFLPHRLPQEPTQAEIQSAILLLGHSRKSSTRYHSPTHPLHRSEPKRCITPHSKARWLYSDLGRRSGSCKKSSCRETSLFNVARDMYPGTTSAGSNSDRRELTIDTDSVYRNIISTNISFVWSQRDLRS